MLGELVAGKSSSRLNTNKRKQDRYTDANGKLTSRSRNRASDMALSPRALHAWRLSPLLQQPPPPSQQTQRRCSEERDAVYPSLFSSRLVPPCLSSPLPPCLLLPSPHSSLPPPLLHPRLLCLPLPPSRSRAPILQSALLCSPPPVPLGASPAASAAATCQPSPPAPTPPAAGRRRAGYCTVQR